ncbi:MAG TPA: hypothetical protein VFV65_00220 [Gemmatimonadales bacterium]|nr:hypothetical protein [Gemmatimonadales bacterium]
MNSRWNSRAALAVVAALALGAGAAACGKDKPPPPAAAARPAPAAGDVAQKEATLLGRDVFELVDRLAAYAASNQRKYPASLRLAGIDSLTPKLARQIDTKAAPPMAFSMYRNPLGHQITSCRGNLDLLEESALNDGRFTVTCTDSQGQSSPYKVQRAAGR